MTTQTTAALPPPTGRAAGPQRATWALVLISVAQLMVVLDSTITNIALPYIGADMDMSRANLTWIVTSYAIPFGGLLLLGGRLGDLYGRRRLFIIGVAVFAASSLLGGLAPNQVVLLVARALQGVGAAMASPAALALVTTIFPPGPERNRGYAVVTTMTGVGGAVGLVLGGWLTEHSWRLTFLINVPVCVAAAVGAPLLLRESERHPGSLDVKGAMAGTLGLLGIVFGLTRAGDQRYGWDDPATMTVLAAAAVLLAAFVWVERRAAHPVLPFSVLADRTRAISFAVMMIVPAAMFSMFFFQSLLIQNVMGYSSLKAGLAFLPFSIGMIATANLSTRLVARVDTRWLAGVGVLLAGAALFGFSRVPYDVRLGHLSVDASYLVNVLPFLILQSIGMGLSFVPLTLTAIHGVVGRDTGVASGVLRAMQQVGGALGLAVLGTVALHVTQDRADRLSAAAAASHSGSTDGQVAALRDAIGRVAFTDGATHAFLAGALLTWLAAALAVVFLNVRHEQLGSGPRE